MDNVNSYIKEEFENGSNLIWKFDNIFRFMDFCHANNLNHGNSITYYDEEEECMYIKKIK